MLNLFTHFFLLCPFAKSSLKRYNGRKFWNNSIELFFVLLIIILLPLECSFFQNATHEMWFLASIIRYELRAIQLEKLKTMATENEKSSDISPHEVEMAETKHTEHISPPSP